MYKGYKITALIPAKMKSKRLPYKNVRLLLGKQLFVYSIDSAKESNYIDEIIVSTDSEYIKKVSLENGVRVLDRPEELCTSESHIKETIKHTFINCDADYILLMNPTSPLRYSVDKFLEEFDPKNYDCAASGYECKIYPWGSTEKANMQSLDPFFYDDGSLYLHKREYIMDNLYWPIDKNRMQKIITPSWMNFEIDTKLDWLIVENLMQKYNAGEIK